MTSSSPYCDHCGAENPPQAVFCYMCGQAFAAQARPPSGGQARPPSGGQSRPASGTPTRRLLNGRYRQVRQVGAGGFGAVHLAEDTHLGDRQVAIKEMSQLGLTPEELRGAVEAFRREALLLAKLLHPNLPRIYEQFHEDGQWYLVMDFIEGETLESSLAQAPGGRLTVAQVLPLAAQLCSVLDYLHTRTPPIIFRDLKPANVLMTSAGQLYLIDFGIARHFKPGQTRDTVAFGSAGYAAPEQYGKAQTTTQADLYSLGATLHQLLSGNDPANSPFLFAPLHVTQLPGLERLIFQLLQQDKAQRPASMAVAQQELQRLAVEYASGEGAKDAGATAARSAALPRSPAGAQPRTSITPPGMALPRVPPSGSGRLGPAAVPVCVYKGHLHAVKAVAWSPDGRLLASGGGDGTVQVWDSVTAKTIYIYREHGAANNTINTVAWSPDGALLASGGSGRLVHIWVATLRDAKIGTTLATYDGGGLLPSVLALAWSPDSRYLAAGYQNKRVALWEARTGETRLAYRGHWRLLGEAGVASVAWSPDGLLLASCSSDETVQVWQANTGKLLVTHSHHASLGGAVRSLAWSPDGKYIASAGTDKTVQAWEASESGRRLLFWEQPGVVNSVAWSPDGLLLATGASDHSVRVWEITASRELMRWSQHRDEVSAVAWSPDGQQVASASHDGTVHVWQVR